jgi:hypothetical protein
MSPLDEGFRRRINAVFDEWRNGFAEVLDRGRGNGSVRRDVDAKQVAAFLVAAIEGTFGVVKNSRSPEMLRSNLEILIRFLDTLRPATA